MGFETIYTIKKHRVLELKAKLELSSNTLFLLKVTFEDAIKNEKGYNKKYREDIRM